MITVNTQVVAPWVMERANCSISSDCQTIGQVSDDKLVAGVMFEHYTGACVVGTIAVESGYSMSREFVRAIFDYPFRQLACDQMLAYVSADNERSKNLLEHMGFELTATVPGVYPENMDIYLMKREACRFLETEDGQENS